MLDGGTVANNSDALAIKKIAGRWPDKFARIEMLSIGTAGADTARRARHAERSGARRVSDFANFMMTVQERTAAQQAQRLLGKRYLRANHAHTSRHAAFENLDVASVDPRTALLAAGTTAARTAYENHRAIIDRTFADRRP